MNIARFATIRHLERALPAHGLGRHDHLPYPWFMIRSAATRLEVRLPVRVHEVLKRAAELEGRTLTDFVVAAAYEAACRTIEQTEVVQLCVEHQERLARALSKARAPGAALGRAFNRRRNLLGS